MRSTIAGRYGTVVSYLRAMFWTPMPTLETSSCPSLRRPTTSDPAELAAAADAPAFPEVASFPAGSDTESPFVAPPEHARSGVAARPPAASRKERRPIWSVRSVGIAKFPLNRMRSARLGGRLEGGSAAASGKRPLPDQR